MTIIKENKASLLGYLLKEKAIVFFWLASMTTASRRLNPRIAERGKMRSQFNNLKQESFIPKSPNSDILNNSTDKK